MGIRKFLQEITSPGVLDDATREFLYPQVRSLANVLEERNCKQIPQILLDYNKIEVGNFMFFIARMHFTDIVYITNREDFI